jgi:hypothetical protein
VTERTTHLNFPLTVEDGWPPVGLECLLVNRTALGYEVQAAPLFIRDVSVGDVLSVTFDSEGRVAAYRHEARAKNSTIWLLYLDREKENVAPFLVELRSVGCDTTSMDDLGCYAVSVPESTPMESVDAILAQLDQDAVAVAFPSMRHEDDL